MNSLALISKLAQQLDKLEQEVLQHDSRLAQGECKLLQNTDRFNTQLFLQTGAKLQPCIQQIRSQIQQLEKRLRVGLNKETIEISCQQIHDQFSAVKRALATTNINLKAARQAKASSRARYINKQQRAHQNSGFEWIASNVMQNSHKLYDELNKHLNWASRIEQKIHALDLQLSTCPSREKLKLQHEILETQKRLGKCRQAISYIEERIALFERPNAKKGY
ncbi:prepilin peptidase [Parashewanella curva]|uniref:Prepilin peptidase n=1 Tax=Parashewanella curva TaxID=2338552 RepID=A0A3L8PYI5_9GAMM|nr:primosomal replication protein [Parashewanella curva]RLV60335.1 prepilin peptidase [Parashewanella curva]